MEDVKAKTVGNQAVGKTKVDSPKVVLNKVKQEPVRTKDTNCTTFPAEPLEDSQSMEDDLDSQEKEFLEEWNFYLVKLL